MKTSFLTNHSLPTSAAYRWILGSVMLTVIALGWKYPLLGFIVPVAMLSGMLGGAFKGRYVCGNLCPRGSFFDTFFAKFGPNRPIPEALFNMKLRWGIVTVLMSFMTWQLAQNLGTLDHWGFVFWQMCALTTAVALVLGILYRPRTWCSVCPVGSIGATAGGKKVQLTVADTCRSCKLCEKNCPMGYSISEFKTAGIMQNKDCLQCGNCVHVCPVAALSLQKIGSSVPSDRVTDEQKNWQNAA